MVKITKMFSQEMAKETEDNLEKQKKMFSQAFFVEFFNPFNYLLSLWGSSDLQVGNHCSNQGPQVGKLMIVFVVFVYISFSLLVFST